MSETIAQKRRYGNKKLDDMLRYHKFTNLARVYGDLAGKLAQKRESKRIKEKILFYESLEGKKCQN